MRFGTVVAVVPILIAISGPPIKFSAADDGCGTDARSEACCSHCGGQKKFLRHCGCATRAPLAPILGSAPAIMAPVVFAPSGPVALPSIQATPSRPSFDRETLRELLGVLNEISPSAAPSSCRNGSTSRSANPLSAPEPPAEESIEQRLGRIDQQLSRLESTVTKLDSQAADVISRLDARLRLLENKK
jgi:hypothetical protein